nr:phospholipase-like protein [Tanacetum cinerariifolium]
MRRALAESDLALYTIDEEIFGKLSDDDAIRLCLLLALAIWILETFERCESWWIKDPKVRALGWSKKSLFTRSDYPYLFSKESRPTSELRPTIAEYQSSWWIDNNLYFQEFVHRAPPIKEHHGLFETYLSKLEKACKCGETGFMVSSIRGTTDNSDYLQEEELRLCLEVEEKMRCEHQQLIVEENRIRLDEAKRLRFEKENMLQLEQQKKNKRKEFMKLNHCKKVLSKLTLAKRIHLCSYSEKIQPKVSWVKIKKYRQQVYDPCIAEFLKSVKPWVELIDLWVDYMWHVRPENSNWAMASCYFVQLLLQNGMPLFDANGERYTTPWSEVDQFHIMSGEVTVYDTGHTYDYDYCDWYVRIRHCLQLVRDTYVSFQHLMVRCEERYEQILELQNLVGSTVVAESVRLLQKFQQDDLESSRGMMRLICETWLKVLKNLSFIALLRTQ